MASDISIPKRIMILPQPDGDVVAWFDDIGEFYRKASGEIYFRYKEGGNHCWYVNRDIAAFGKSAAIFNRTCELHVDDDDTDDDAAWSLIVARLKDEFESVEPLGDPEESLWSATIHDCESGLLSLF